jgi:hypothetical protein
MAAGVQLLFWWARLLFEKIPRVSTNALAQPETSTASSQLRGPTTACCLWVAGANSPCCCPISPIASKFSQVCRLSRTIQPSSYFFAALRCGPMTAASPHHDCKRHAKRGTAPPSWSRLPKHEPITSPSTHVRDGARTAVLVHLQMLLDRSKVSRIFRYTDTQYREGIQIPSSTPPAPVRLTSGLFSS